MCRDGLKQDGNSNQCTCISIHTLTILMCSNASVHKLLEQLMYAALIMWSTRNGQKTDCSSSFFSQPSAIT